MITMKLWLYRRKVHNAKSSKNHTSGFTPVTLKFVIAIRLMADKPFRPLFDDCRPVYWSDSHFDCFFQKRGSEPRGDTAARKGKRNRQTQTLLEWKCGFIFVFVKSVVKSKKIFSIDLRASHFLVFYLKYIITLLLTEFYRFFKLKQI